MNTVDVFGRSTKNSVSILKILSNGGLTFRNDSLSVKINPNANNVLSLSPNGLMGNGIKSTGGTMTGNLDMGGNSIMGLETNYPPRHRTQAASWGQVRELVNDLEQDLNNLKIKNNVGF